MNKTFEEKLKKYFTVSKGRDCYGVCYTIEELGHTFYAKDIEKYVSLLAQQYKYALSGKPVKALNREAEIDNEHARFLGLREYEVVRVIPTKNYVTFAVVIRFKDTGEEHIVRETGLDYEIKFDHNYEGCERYFTAGGLNDKKVDFIFRGVGHSSKNGFYTVRDQQEYVAEKDIKALMENF